MAGFTVLSQEHADGTKTKYRIPRWQIYGPIIFFIIVATTIGLVMGLVVIPDSNRKAEEGRKSIQESQIASGKKFNDTVNEIQKKIEKDRNRNSCFSSCTIVSCLVQCDISDNACRDKCREARQTCEQNCSQLYPESIHPKHHHHRLAFYPTRHNSSYPLGEQSLHGFYVGLFQ
ncbi:hypothetical protein BJ944DRAFT_251916 [Cunninghamella echinulata]|nr:hypothetical protein BJ944DRAFT_251916 [Cunninghamella echinulata]